VPHAVLVEKPRDPGGRIERCLPCRNPPRSVRRIDNRGKHEWYAAAFGRDGTEPVAAAVDDLSIEVAHRVKDLKCVLDWNRLALPSTQIRLEGVTEASVRVLIRPKRPDNIGRSSAIETKGEKMAVEQPGAAEDEAPGSFEICGTLPGSVIEAHRREPSAE
jgi:hypothetical protein